MYHFRRTWLFPMLMCVLLVSPAVADSAAPEVERDDEREIQRPIIETDTEELANEDGAYDLYRAEAALAKKASANCSAVVSFSSSGNTCEAANGAACSCEDDCDCEADEDSCSCDCRSFLDKIIPF